MSGVTIPYPTVDDLHRKSQLGRTHAERFSLRYVPAVSGCWEWTRGRTTNGYGHFSVRSTYYQAHRIAYILHRGPVPTDMELDHLCRNRRCVNPTHLEVVTPRENSRRGSGTKLTRESADAIRAAVASGMSQRRVARLFAIDHSTVSRIVAGKRWSEKAEAAA